MASTQVQKLVQLYQALAKNPSQKSASILHVGKDSVTIESNWLQRNLERKTNQYFGQTYILNSDLNVLSESFPIDTTTERLSITTDDGQRRAVLRQGSAENSSAQFIEIWEKRGRLKNYDLTALDVHGPVYTDTVFPSFEWSADKTKLLYVAEKKLPKSGPFYTQEKRKKKENDKKDDEETTVGNEYLYKQDWGEQLVGKHIPVVVVLNIVTDEINIVSEIPAEVSPGQVTWAKDGQIIGVAWLHEPRRLGLVECTNRISWIFVCKDGEYKKISDEGKAVKCPRLSPDKKHLIWLEREAGGPHHNAKRLMHLDLESDGKQPEVLVDVVTTSIPIENKKEFFGIYGQLPRRCWSNDSRYILFSTPQQTAVHSYIVDIKKKSVKEINKDGERSLSVLDVKDDIVVFAEASIMEPSFISVAKFVTEKHLDIKHITNPPVIPGFEDMMYETMHIAYDSKEEINNFNCTYFGPKSGKEKSVPLIVTPHGGPHSNFANMYRLDHSLLALAGFALLQVNFRGSTGMGSKNVEYLQGRVGNTDVKDCVTATNEALKKYNWLDPERIAGYGGSHGGFLVAHLSGQHPDMYKAIVARNPVIDIAAMFTVSDIPDWCAAEINAQFDESKINETNQLDMCSKMFNCSPIVHAHKVKAPTLLCIGTNDLRVPCSQGKLWYHRLKANNVKTKMLVYEDNHPLNSGAAEIDNIINSCLWFLEHTSKE